MERSRSRSAARLGSLFVAALAACSGGSGGGGGPPPVCTSGAVESCYTGPVSTSGVGACHAGTRTCVSGAWGACAGEVLPTVEACGNGVDDDCDGTVDGADLDGDGFTTCEGDACDSVADGCPAPTLVNPGAFEVQANGVDDDCDGEADEVEASCDAGLSSGSADAVDYAKALGVCQTTTAGGRTWGLLSARIVRADGTGDPAAEQRSVRPAFGATVPREGAAMTVLSTGHAAAPGHTNPSYAAFQRGAEMGTTAGFPADWYAANGGALPNAPGCPAPAGTTANDSVLLELTLRTPTNARSFALDADFFSAEYPEWTCSAYNDFFVVLLDSAFGGAPANPADKNLAVHAGYPVGVNLAHGDTGLFKVCENGSTGCVTGATAGTISTCTGTAELAGTGFDDPNPPGGGCGTNDLAGGGTGWLTVRGNVAGGEVVTLRIALWDTSDAILDSLALVDAFRWSLDLAVPGAGD